MPVCLLLHKLQFQTTVATSAICKCFERLLLTVFTENTLLEHLYSCLVMQLTNQLIL